MTTTMTPGVLPDTWDVRCDQHGLDRRGLAQAHAANLVRKHDREDHAEDFQVGSVAALVLAAQEDVHLARQEQDPEGDKGWALRKAQAHLDEVLAVWMTLLALPLSERDRALALARQHSAAATIAHPAPF